MGLRRERDCPAIFLGETPLRLGRMKELPLNTFQARILSAKIQQDQEWKAKWESSHCLAVLRFFLFPQLTYISGYRVAVLRMLRVVGEYTLTYLGKIGPLLID